MSTALVTAIPTTLPRIDVAVAPPYGRFSTGMERSAGTSTNARVGRFSDGMQQWYDGSATERVGRFSTGMEHRPVASEALRVGSFADGCERIGRR
jgi:hypothetical protein